MVVSGYSDIACISVKHLLNEDTNFILWVLNIYKYLCGSMFINVWYLDEKRSDKIGSTGKIPSMPNNGYFPPPSPQRSSVLREEPVFTKYYIPDSTSNSITLSILMY